MFPNFFYKVLQYRYYQAKAKASQAVHELDKANQRFADAANALNKHEVKMIRDGNSKSVIGETSIN
jgi:hypothetical protein